MSVMRLIDANALVEEIRELLYTENRPSMILNNFSQMCFNSAIELAQIKALEAPTIDAVPREEYESLLKRFRHLLESDYIRSFDEVKLGTGEYKRDIREADREHPHGRWIERIEIFSESEGEVNAIGCSECGRSQRKYRRTLYCPNCGAKMDDKEDGRDGNC